MAVGSQLPPGLADQGDAGVVHQRVQAGVVAQDRGSQRAHLLQRGEVCRVETRASLTLGLDFCHEFRAALDAATVEYDVVAARGERPGDLAP